MTAVKLMQNPPNAVCFFDRQLMHAHYEPRPAPWFVKSGSDAANVDGEEKQISLSRNG